MRRMRSIRASVLVVAVLLAACRTAAPTKVAAVADVGAKIESSASALLQQAQTAQASGFISRGQLDVVALAVDKIGHAGLDLEAGLRDYRAVQSAGKDVTAQRAAVQAIIAHLTTALQDIGQQIPNGTVAGIDQAVTSIFGIIAQVKAGVL